MNNPGTPTSRFRGSICNFCKREIAGAKWTCAACSVYHLCTICYLNGAHNFDHMFWRCDAPGSQRQLVFPRRTSVLFGGASDIQQDTDEQTAEIHGITCCGCRRGIVGTRWKCAVCLNTDICSRCYSAHVHNLDHVFLRFNRTGSHGMLVPPRGEASGKQPAADAPVQCKDASQDRQQKDNAAKFQGLACHSCEERSIIGALWMCEDCSKYKLCTTCYLTGAHDHDHMFSRLDAPRKKKYPVVPRRTSVIYGGNLNGHEETFSECAVHNVSCKGCSRRRIAGARWKCAVCFDYDLCSTCFYARVHQLDHVFLRYDEPGSPGVHAVPLRIYGSVQTADTSTREKYVSRPRHQDEHARKPKENPDGNRPPPEDLATRLQELEETIKCGICMERRRNVAFLCGHTACADCADKLRICHICRVHIKMKIKLY